MHDRVSALPTALGQPAGLTSRAVARLLVWPAVYLVGRAYPRRPPAHDRHEKEGDARVCARTCLSVLARASAQCADSLFSAIPHMCGVSVLSCLYLHNVCLAVRMFICMNVFYLFGLSHECF